LDGVVSDCLKGWVTECQTTHLLNRTSGVNAKNVIALKEQGLNLALISNNQVRGKLLVSSIMIKVRTFGFTKGINNTGHVNSGNTKKKYFQMKS
jgi:hypothetical protein